MGCSSGPPCVGFRRLRRHWRDCSAWRLGALALFCLQSWHGPASFANATFTHCVSDEFSDLYIMVEANVSNAQGPTQHGNVSEPILCVSAGYGCSGIAADLAQALGMACARVGGCRQTERDQAMDMLVRAWSDEEWNKNRATAAQMGISVVALAMNYALDRSVTISYQSPSLNNETRFRLGPSQEVDSAVAVHCHRLGLHLTDPACFEAAYYARVGRAQVPPGAWCMDFKDAIHSFTRRLLDQRKPLPSSSKWTQLERRRELYDALEHEFNVTAPSDMTLRGELTWHASLLPPQDKLYGPHLPLRVQLHYRPPANTTGGRPVHVLELSAVAQFLGEPLYVATRLTGCPWSVSTVHPSSSLDIPDDPLLVSCDARPLAVDDVNGGRLVGLQVFESSHLAPLSRLMAVAGKQQRPSPPPPEVAPYRSPALYPPSFAATLTPRELKADAAVLDQALASLLESDRGQEAVQAFRDVYAFDEKGTRLPNDIMLHWTVFHNQDRYVTLLAGCERLANGGSLGDFLKCLDMRAMDDMITRMRESEATQCTQAPIVRNGMLRVADLDKALASALLAGGRFSVDRWQRLKQWAEELVLPTWEVLSVDTTTDKLAFHGYQRFYGPAFATLRSSAVRVMELGSREGSVHLWPRVFPGGRFILVDILFADNCQPCRLGDGMWGHRVDLHDEEQVQQLAETYASLDKQVDVIVDDGSHLPFAQVLAFKHLFEKALKPGGLFVIEDTELSYHTSFKEQSLFPHMLSVVDIINREYIDPLLDYPPLGEVAPLVSSVAFGQNCIILRKKDEADEPFNGRLYRMRSFVQNYTVGGYDEELALQRFTVKEEQPPQHPDLIEDGVAKIQWSRVEVPGTAVV